MKSLWNALSIFAVANMIAMALVVGWLYTSDRLDADRAKGIREMFSVTLTDFKSTQEAVVREAESKEALRLEAEKAAKPPVTAAERLAARLEANELDRERAERLKREVADLQRGMADGQIRLDGEWAKLRAAQQAHAAEVRRNEETVGSTQFQKSLGVLGKLEPKDAKSILVELLGGTGQLASPVSPRVGSNATSASGGLASASAGVSPGRMQVLSYLDAMSDKARTAVLTEFVKDDPRLAAELLEGLRIRGTFAAVSAAR